MCGLSWRHALAGLISSCIASPQSCDLSPQFTTEYSNATALLDIGRGSSLVQISRASRSRLRKAVWEISLPISRLGTLDEEDIHGLENNIQGTALAETDAKGGTSPHVEAPFDRSQYVAVPTYIHDKPATEDANVSGNTISEALGNDLLGDSLEPTSKGVGKKELPGHAHKHEGHHGHVALLYFMVDLIAGAIILYVLERMIPNLPYTVALFLAGCVMGFSHFSGWSKHVWPTWYQTVMMWQTINPHMLFFGFLPTLIFGEAMRLNAQLVKQCFGQILLLACPGVLIGTFLIAAFAVYVLPYGWDWPIALVFGSILSATDPVAVVALFNTLGVSPQLTMLISGESLLNDGTAMAVFALMLKVVLGAQVNAWGIAVFFAHMTLTSTLWGIVLGTAVVYFIGLCADEKQPSDLMLQVIITICASYMAFFVAESEFSTSGVLATVACGYCVALNGWPRFVSREAVTIVWEAIEFIGNTVIFFLAGLLFVFNVITRRQYIGFADVGWLFALYIAVTAIRGIMVLILWPALNAAGAKIKKKEAIVMIWSGLRGAVALAMAIIVDREEDVPTQTGSRIMFHIGGLAALTTLVNATTTAPLLRYLDLTKTSGTKDRCLGAIGHDIHLDISRKFEEKMAGHEDLRCQGANEDLVRAMVPALNTRPLPSVFDESGVPSWHPLPANMTQTEKDEYLKLLTRIYRKTFLQVVRTHYWEAIEEGMCPSWGLTARFLLESVDEAMEQTNRSLNDWSALERKLDLNAVNQPPSVLSRVVDTWPFSESSDLRGMYSQERIVERVVNVCLTFMEVHTRAQKEVPHLFLGTASTGSTSDALDEAASQVVIKESAAQFHRVIEVLSILPTTTVEISKSKMFARELLCLQSHRLNNMQRKGFLTEKEAQRLEHEIHIAIRRLLHTKHAEWLATKVGEPSVGLE